MDIRKSEFVAKTQFFIPDPTEIFELKQQTDTKIISSIDKYILDHLYFPVLFWGLQFVVPGW